MIRTAGKLCLDISLLHERAARPIYRSNGQTLDDAAFYSLEEKLDELSGLLGRGDGKPEIRSDSREAIYTTAR